MPGWLLALDRYFPIRYLFWLFCAVAALLSAFVWVAFDQWGWVTLLFALLVALGVRDSLQSRRAVLRNYPVIGHFRFLLEFIRPEIRQYFIESDNEAHPFSRQQRSLVYQRAKGDPDGCSARSAAQQFDACTFRVQRRDHEPYRPRRP
jgi:hypothetical protein